MSKAKGKDKKKDDTSGLEAKFEEQKRQILENTFTIQRLQDRISRMNEENHHITHTRESFEKNYEEQLDKQRIIIETHENTIKELREKVYDLELAKITNENRIKDLEKECKTIETNKTREFEEYKKLTQTDLLKYQTQLKDYNFYMNEREQMDSDNKLLREQLEHEKNDKIRQVADKQREKVQATDTLKNEMLKTISETKNNLMSLRKEQLETTTRLTVLQNHQLTGELQFQSKQSQKLIVDNEALQKKVYNLEKDLQIHKDVEEELAKRSNYSRGIIKKLTSKVSELQEENTKLKEQQNAKNEQMVQEEEFQKKGNIIKALDQSLENTQKKYIQLQTNYEGISSDNSELKKKLEAQEKKSDKLIALLFRYYEEILKGDIEAKDESYQYDLAVIRKKRVEEWAHQEVKLVVVALLNLLRTFLNRKTLGLPVLNKNQVSIIDEDEVSFTNKLPRISEHSVSSKLNVSAKMKEVPVHIASKIVGSNIREWGKTVHTSSVSQLSRKYKLFQR